MLRLSVGGPSVEGRSLRAERAGPPPARSPGGNLQTHCTQGLGQGSCGSSEPFLPPGCLWKFWGVFALSPTPPPPVPSVCCGLGGGSVFSIRCRLLAREFQQLRVQQRVSRVGTEVAPWDGSWRPSPALSVLPGPGPGLGEVIFFPDCQSSIPSFPLKVTSHCHGPTGAGPAPSCPRPCPQEPGLREPSHSLENGGGLQR